MDESMIDIDTADWKALDSLFFHLYDGEVYPYMKSHDIDEIIEITSCCISPISMVRYGIAIPDLEGDDLSKWVATIRNIWKSKVDKASRLYGSLPPYMGIEGELRILS